MFIFFEYGSFISQGCEKLCLFPLRWSAYISSGHLVVPSVHMLSTPRLTISLHLTPAMNILWEIRISTWWLWGYYSGQPTDTPGFSGDLLWHWVQSLFWCHLGSSQIILEQRFFINNKFNSDDLVFAVVNRVLHN